MNKNLLTKLKKNKKGFTLIELIVVIAILGILAAIAIPRFGGFTEKAKVGNDEQYAALVANATNIIVASGDVAYTAGATITIDISPNGSVADITGVTFGGTGHLANIAAFRTEIEKLVAKEALQSTTYANGMTISATDSGVGTIATKTVANPS